MHITPQTLPLSKHWNYNYKISKMKVTSTREQIVEMEDTAVQEVNWDSINEPSRVQNSQSSHLNC